MSGTGGVDARFAEFARRLLRRCGRAALATSLGGAPYASLVLIAADYDGSPLLLLSDLARHTRNIGFDPRVSLLLDGTEGYSDPLAGPRLTVLGQACPSAEPHLLSRFAARHPASRAYAGFADFRLYRVSVGGGHLVAGFGRIERIDGAELILTGDARCFAEAEAALIERLNRDRQGVLDRCAHRLGAGAGWQAAGIDPEGVDLRRGEDLLRVEFPSPLGRPEAVPRALAELAKSAAE